jgi:hypothetical protein
MDILEKNSSQVDSRFIDHTQGFEIGDFLLTAEVRVGFYDTLQYSKVIHLIPVELKVTLLVLIMAFARDYK